MKNKSHLTTDPTDPRLTHGSDEVPAPQAQVYLVLSEEERKKGFVRPYRNKYIHVGLAPKNPLRELTEEEKERYEEYNYVMFEPYGEEEAPKTGRFWTQKELDNRACGGETTMGQELSETYARDQKFYGGTYCAVCKMHRPVAEFVWSADNQVVGS